MAPFTAPYWEVHITYDVLPSERDFLKRRIERNPGWTFSNIFGDPALGKANYCYATAHYSKHIKKTEVMDALHDMIQHMQASGWKHIREKIERVTYDKRI